MTKVVIFNNEKTGCLSILIPAEKIYVPVGVSPLKREDFLAPGRDFGIPDGYREATLEEVAMRDIPAGVQWHVVPRTSIPEDRYFRDAWLHEAGALYIHMDKAREVHKNALREKRAEILIALDTAYLQADERGDSVEKAIIAQKKQSLRDITAHPDLDAVTDLDALKQVGMDVLAAVK